MVIAKNFRELLMYERAYAASLNIHRLSQDFPKNEQYGGIADQIRRSSKSICANIAEGFGRNKFPKEFHRFLWLSHGSADETRVWLDYCRDLNYIDIKVHAELAKDYIEIGAMIRAFAHKIKTQSLVTRHLITYFFKQRITKRNGVNLLR